VVYRYDERGYPPLAPPKGEYLKLRLLFWEVAVWSSDGVVEPGKGAF